MKKLLFLIGVVLLVVLFFGVRMYTQKETVIAHQEMKKTNENKFSPLSAPTKKLTPVQKKLQELGFFPNKFQSIQIKTEN